jgi:CheY-like chemotaxis protein
VKILVCEDDPVMLLVLNRMLEKMQYEVINAKDGKEAIDLINTARPDIVITDISLPVFSGLDIISFLKNLPRKKTPAILISALPMNAFKSNDGNFGSDAYFMKPVNADQLQATLEELRKEFKL